MLCTVCVFALPRCWLSHKTRVSRTHQHWVLCSMQCMQEKEENGPHMMIHLHPTHHGHLNITTPMRSNVGILDRFWSIMRASSPLKPPSGPGRAPIGAPNRFCRMTFANLSSIYFYMATLLSWCDLHEWNNYGICLLASAEEHNSPDHTGNIVWRNVATRQLCTRGWTLYRDNTK